MSQQNMLVKMQHASMLIRLLRLRTVKKCEGSTIYWQPSQVLCSQIYDIFNEVVAAQ